MSNSSRSQIRVLIEEVCSTAHYPAVSDSSLRITVHLPQFFRCKLKSLMQFPCVWDAELQPVLTKGVKQLCILPAPDYQGKPPTVRSTERSNHHLELTTFLLILISYKYS